jgi:hypothetical protein
MSLSTEGSRLHRSSRLNLPTWLSDRTGGGFRTQQTGSPSQASHRRATKKSGSNVRAEECPDVEGRRCPAPGNLRSSCVESTVGR